MGKKSQLTPYAQISFYDRRIRGLLKHANSLGIPLEKTEEGRQCDEASRAFLHLMFELEETEFSEEEAIRFKNLYNALCRKARAMKLIN